MKLGVPKETLDGEQRVALAPDGVVKLVDRGVEVLVQAGAGRDYNVDEAYEEAGAQVVGDAEELWRTADVVAKVRAPTEGELELAHEGSIVISFLQPVQQAELVGELAGRGVTVLSMDAIPRIARAQSMDALSSMSSISGYKGVVIGADALGKYLPMMTTAAGTTKAAKVLVLGAGVAGLQAIATARRLGAEVSAFDIRPEVKEQIESLGAKFVEPEPEEPEEEEEEIEAEEPPRGLAGLMQRFRTSIGADELVPSAGEDEDSGDEEEEEEEEEDDDASAPGGYAREQDEEKQRQDRELVSERLRETDVVITTALIPGKPAPTLITKEMVDGMAPGSVVVDLAAEAGGNCELTKAGEVVEHGLVHIHGPLDLPSSMPIHASQLYSRNVVSLVSHLVDDDGNLELDFEDEITDGVVVAHEGEVRHADAREALGQEPLPPSPAEKKREREEAGTDEDGGGGEGGVSEGSADSEREASEGSANSEGSQSSEASVDSERGEASGDGERSDSDGGREREAAEASGRDQ